MASYESALETAKVLAEISPDRDPAVIYQIRSGEWVFAAEYEFDSMESKSHVIAGSVSVVYADGTVNPRSKETSH